MHQMPLLVNSLDPSVILFVLEGHTLPFAATLHSQKVFLCLCTVRFRIAFSLFVAFLVAASPNAAAFVPHALVEAHTYRCS
jgi:hypothetical protein